MKSILLKSLLLMILLCGAGSRYYYLSDGYFINRFICDPRTCSEWTTYPLDENEQKNLSSLLSQPYAYLGEGGQSYVFASEDQRYVLKLFKFNRFKPAWFVSMLPDVSFMSAIRQKHTAKRFQKQVVVFTGHQTAFELHKMESGLVFIQLSPSHVKQEIVLVDWLGIKRKVDLGELVYVLQEKGEILSTVFSSLLDKGEVGLVKHRMGQVLDLYQTEFLKGIYDTDHGVMHNIGFVGDRPIHLDVGKFVRDEAMKDPAVHQVILLKIANKMRAWIGKFYPQYEEEIYQ